MQADRGLLDSSGSSNCREGAELLQALSSSILLQRGCAEHGYCCSYTSALENTGNVVPMGVGMEVGDGGGGAGGGGGQKEHVSGGYTGVRSVFGD